MIESFERNIYLANDLDHAFIGMNQLENPFILQKFNFYFKHNFL